MKKRIDQGSFYLYVKDDLPELRYKFLMFLLENVDGFRRHRGRVFARHVPPDVRGKKVLLHASHGLVQPGCAQEVADDLLGGSPRRRHGEDPCGQAERSSDPRGLIFVDDASPRSVRREASFLLRWGESFWAE